MLEWISIEEQRPDSGVLVIVTDGRQSDVGFFDSNDNMFSSEYSFCDEDGITHWMPLPEPPSRR